MRELFLAPAEAFVGVRFSLTVMEKTLTCGGRLAARACKGGGAPSR